jgi:hypothetical protein
MYEFSIPGQLRTVQGGTIGLRCMVFPYTSKARGLGQSYPRGQRGAAAALGIEPRGQGH